MYIGSGGGGAGADANLALLPHLTVIVQVSGGMIVLTQNLDLDRNHVEYDNALLSCFAAPVV